MAELSETLAQVQAALAAQFGERVSFQEPFRGDLTAVCGPETILDLLAALRAEPLGFGLLSDVTAVDRLPAVPRFEVVYHLLALATGARIRVKVKVGDAQPVPSITSLWSGANYMEREVFDMFGIPFSGHPNLERILTADGLEGHPLRRDFPIGGEPVAFDIPHRKRFSDATN